jgi:hypothetical protein
VDDGALANALPELVKKKLEGYLQGSDRAGAGAVDVIQRGSCGDGRSLPHRNSGGIAAASKGSACTASSPPNVPTSA